MTPTTPEKSERRKNLLNQLATFLQVDVEPDDGGAGSRSSFGCLGGRGGRNVVQPASESDDRASEAWASEKQREIGRRQGSSTADDAPAALQDDFLPIAPKDFAGFRLAEAEVESLALKFLLHCHTATGRDVSQQIGVTFGICEKLLQSLKTDRLVVIKGDCRPERLRL